MEFMMAKKQQWAEIREIYLEAFPKRERKPYFVLRRSVRKKKAIVMTAVDGGQMLGFAVLIPYKDMVMVDYLAVSSKIRSKGTGSYMIQNICSRFSDKKVVLLIERVDEEAENKEQRIARWKILSQEWICPGKYFYNGSRRGDGNHELWRGGFGGGLYRYTRVCAWKTAF